MSQGLPLGFFSSLVLYQSSHSIVINAYLLSASYESGAILEAKGTAIKEVALFMALRR